MNFVTGIRRGPNYNEALTRMQQTMEPESDSQNSEEDSSTEHSGQRMDLLLPGSYTRFSCSLAK